LGIVLDRAGLGIVLRQLGVAAGDHLALEIHDQRGRTGRTLIEGEDVAAGVHRPVSRFARSGRSLITMSTPRSIMRRRSGASLTVQADTRIPAARAAVMTSAAMSRWLMPRSLAPRSCARRTASGGPARRPSPSPPGNR